MVHNYIGGLRNYYDGTLPLAFFTYIAGGFGKNINSQIAGITRQTQVQGSAVSVSGIISLVEHYSAGNYDHSKLRGLFSIGRQIILSDITV
jgi:hypothetical protein